MVMAGKRVVTAGVLAATLAVAVALWSAPATPRGLAAHAVRQVKTTVAVDHRPGVVHAFLRSATPSPAGAVAAAARQALDDIEAALDRMDAGRYGYCTGCDGAIPWERLEAIPQAPLCMRCQRREEHRR